MFTNNFSIMGKLTSLGAVPVIENEKLILNLTGSASIYEIGGYKILVDFGMFQGCSGADFYNKEYNDLLTDIDIVLVTHGHIDHNGRLALLPKMGFKGDIIMTPATKEITAEMLLDSCKIGQREAIAKAGMYNSLRKKLKLGLKIKNYLEKLQNTLIDSDEKSKIDKFLEARLGKNHDKKKALDSVNEYLKENKIENDKDIDNLIKELTAPLFNLNDIIDVMGLIKTIDVSEEKILRSKIIKSENQNTEDADYLDNLPYNVAKGFNEKLNVTSKRGIREIKEIWEGKLKEEIKKVIESGIDFKLQKDLFKKEIESYLIYIEQYKFIDNEERDLNKIQFENRVEYKDIRKNLKNYKKLLKDLGIENKSDLERIINDDEKIIDLLKIEIPFNRDDIEKALKLLQIQPIEEKREIIGIRTFDTAHIVGSVGFEILSGEVKNKVRSLLDITEKKETITYSGDVGRYHDNRIGKPEIPLYGTDYFQLETTYAGRNHLDKKIAIENLLNGIRNSKGPVLIPVFSQQRTQEISMVLMEELIKLGEECDDFQLYIDGPLATKITEIYKKYRNDVYNLLDENEQIKVFGKVIFKTLAEGEYEKLYSENENQIDKNLKYLDYTNPLLNNLADNKKNLLNKKIKKYLKSNSDENLLEEIKNFIGEESFKKLVLEKSNKKIVVLATSGMMDGGAIENHLSYILENPDATILAPGYLSEGTRGHKIVIQKDEFIDTPEGKVKNLCNSEKLDGFSSHIGHDEILEYLSDLIKNGKFNPNATLGLTHTGDLDGLKVLVKDIEELLIGLNRTDIKIKIPGFGETFFINNKREIENEKPKIKFITKKEDLEYTTPDFLLGEIKGSEIDEKDDFFELSQEQKLYINSVNESINLIQDKIEKKFNEIKEILEDIVFKKIGKDINLIENEDLELIKTLSTFQQNILLQDVDKKLAKNKEIENQISKIKQNIGYLNNLLNIEYDNIINEIELIKKEILIQTNKLNLRLEELSEINKKLGEDKYSLGDLEIEKLQKDKKLIEKKISETQDTINLLNKQSINLKINFRTRFKSYVGKDNFERITNFEDIWKDIYVFNSIKEDSQNIINGYKSEITLLRGELKSDINIHFKTREEYFKGENLFDILYKNNSEKVDIELLKEYISKGYIPNEDLKYISELLSIVETDKIKIKKIDKEKAGRNLRKYFKTKSKENLDLGVEGFLDIGNIKNYCLSILQELFSEEYYQNYIINNFNVYVFLKSKKGFIEFIKDKYNLEKLKHFIEYKNTYKEYIDELEYFNLMLSNLNNKAREINSENKDDIDFFIYSTIREVEELLMIN